MKATVAASAAVLVALVGSLTGTAPAAASPGPDPDTVTSWVSPPYIDHTDWSHWEGLLTLRIYPTPTGRAAAQLLSDTPDEAWAEVLALAPDADTAGMRAQFVCHWEFAEFAQPWKTSWNIEPWRQVVGDAEMLATECNPGGWPY